MKRRLLGILMAGVLLLSLCGCTIGDTRFLFETNRPQSNNQMFAINDAKCTRTQAKLYLANYQNLYGSAYGIDLWGHDFGTEAGMSLSEYVKNITLNQLSHVFCMEQLAKAGDIRLNDAEEKMVSLAAEEYFASLNDAEKSYIGAELADIREYYRQYALADKYYGIMTQGVNEEVSDDEARVVRIRQIYVRDAATAQKVAVKLETGEDFATVAGTYNLADSIETTISRSDCTGEMEDVIFGLDDGERSGQILAEDGYYFVQCINKYEKELTELHKLDIIAERQKKQFDDAFTEFIENSAFELNENAWEQLSVTTDGSIKTDGFFATYEKYFK